MNLAEQLARIRRGCVELISEPELTSKLASGRALIIKAGFDPTAPDLHLGHTVLLRKLRHFQDLGHKVIFLIGDATALVGDPSGQTVTRKVLTSDAIEANAKTYIQQISQTKLLNTTDSQRFQNVYNSTWFLSRAHLPQGGTPPFDFAQFVKLASKITVARLIERADFTERLKAGKPLSFLELFYPIMQAYDSVKIAEQFGHCDVELGGTDQKFNLLMGRELLKEYGHEPQVVLTMPLLEGTDGVQKMSKSLGNHIGISEPPGEMFGKVMSIPDALIVKYFTLLTDRDDAWIKSLEGQLSERAINPRDAKADLAAELVTIYHGADAAARAREEFSKVFSRKEQPSEMPAVSIEADVEGQVNLVELLVRAKLAKTNNDARRLIRQGGVKLGGAPVATPAVALAQAEGAVLQVGSRHFLRLIR